ASGLELSSIAAVVIGGTSLSGGRGTFIGSLIGVIFISVIGSGLVLMGVNSQAQNVVRGVLILIAVLVNVIFKRESKQI
ncbi:MAG: ABC transporter permease, partial [Anaerolineae bacterium]|nr:ABC transporter permease [Anaerolineae bacterium]